MKKIITFLFFVSFLLVNSKHLTTNNNVTFPKGFNEQKSASISFSENKGQVHDQNYKPRPDVLFSGVNQGMVFHLRNNGVSYQLTKFDSVKKEATSSPLKTIDPVKKRFPDRFEILEQTSTIYRLDINWLNINTHSRIIKGKPYEGFNNYYTTNCPSGLLNVKSFEDVTYNNIYNGIDLKWYQQNNQLKYDYIVSAGADYGQIQFEIAGALDININTKGELELKTPFGTIIEQAPFVTQNGKILPSSWKVNKNNVTFDIQNINPYQSFIIDPPVRVWGTYYGGAQADIGISSSVDASGNVFMTGETRTTSGTSIATAGAHQTSFGAGLRDGFLVKFNSAGVRQWGTYYGGSLSDYGYACSASASGDIYIVGVTTSTANISTTGAHQSLFGGGSGDAFLVKFNSAGVRQWGTYYGGTFIDQGFSCCTDASGDVYMAGTTQSFSNIATAGGHQPVYGGSIDAFLVKFNSAGSRLWATYYGGLNGTVGYSCAADLSGNVFLAGTTFSDNDIATPGSFQSAYSYNFSDAFLVKFNSAGVRQWGTYWGSAGSSNEKVEGYCCATDAAGDVYISGMTDDIATMSFGACHQCSQVSGTLDAILGKFSSTGAGIWGTYYGGFGSDYGRCCFTDAASNVYMVGETGSSTNIATAASHQSAIGGSQDAFLVQFNASGLRQWGTYYGGTSNDIGRGGCVDASGYIYLAGESLSSAPGVISTLGSHQASFGGGSNDAFLVQFTSGCQTSIPPPISTTSPSLSICSNTTAVISASVTGASINWYASQTSTLILGTGLNYNTTTLTAGTYTYFAESANSCTVSTTRTPITLTVNPSPTVSVNSGVICSGGSFSIIPAGANTYTIQGGASVVSPTATTNYTVVGVNTQGCLSSNTAVSNVTVNALPSISIVSASSVICVGQSSSITASGGATYTWNTNATTAVIIVSPTVTTTYTVVGTGANSCSKTATITQSVSTCTGVDNLTVNGYSFKIYPNPTNGIINISPAFLTKEDIQIVDVLGKICLFSYIKQDDKIIIDIQNLTAGIYFLKIKQKIMIQLNYKR